MENIIDYLERETAEPIKEAEETTLKQIIERLTFLIGKGTDKQKTKEILRIIKLRGTQNEAEEIEIMNLETEKKEKLAIIQILKKAQNDQNINEQDVLTYVILSALANQKNNTAKFQTFNYNEKALRYTNSPEETIKKITGHEKITTLNSIKSLIKNGYIIIHPFKYNTYIINLDERTQTEIQEKSHHIPKTTYEDAIRQSNLAKTIKRFFTDKIIDGVNIKHDHRTK